MASRLPRNTPLKIQKDSHVIHKPSPSSSAQQQRRRPPIIIYARPPKIIQTTVYDFKAIVQKYTGRPQSAAKECSSSSSSSSSSSAPPPPSPPTSPQTTGFDVSSSSSSTSFPERGIIGSNELTTKAVAAAAAPDLSIRSLPPPADPFLSDETSIDNLLAPDESFNFLGPWGAPMILSTADTETFDSIWASTYLAQ